MPTLRIGLTRLDSDPGVIHVTADVSQDLALQPHVADLDAVLATLLGRGGRGELDVLDTKVGEGLRDLHLRLGVEEGIGELGGPDRISQVEMRTL